MITLQKISNIRFGAQMTASHEGNVAYLQLKHFEDEVLIEKNIIEKVVAPNGDTLKNGEILFVGKGSRIFAWKYHSLLPPAIPSTSFFIIRITTGMFLPEYVTAMLNTPQAHAYFSQIGAGTKILSIRKSELGAFPIPELPLEKQKTIAHFAALHQKQKSITKKILNYQDELFKSVITKIYN